jgi:hypothetical protein
MEERQQFTIGPHEMYILEEPEGKTLVEIGQRPKFADIREEFRFHVESKAFRTVRRTRQQGWDKESLLAAIAEGQVDGFTQDLPIQFPPTPDGDWIIGHTAYLFDDRDFGNRLANTVLAGFRREPREVDPIHG